MTMPNEQQAMYPNQGRYVIPKKVPKYMIGFCDFLGIQQQTSYESFKNDMHNYWPAYQSTGKPRKKTSKVQPPKISLSHSDDVKEMEEQTEEQPPKISHSDDVNEIEEQQYDENETQNKTEFQDDDDEDETMPDVLRYDNNDDIDKAQELIAAITHSYNKTKTYLTKTKAPVDVQKNFDLLYKIAKEGIQRNIK